MEHNQKIFYQFKLNFIISKEIRVSCDTLTSAQFNINTDFCVSIQLNHGDDKIDSWNHLSKFSHHFLLHTLHDLSLIC